ncbi:MAG TPA: TolC family protein [Myxococcales bacterium]
MMLSTAAAAQQRPPLTLDEAVKIALQRNPDLQRQILLSLSAQQDVIISRANILPSVDFNASLGGLRTNGLVVVQGTTVGNSTTANVTRYFGNYRASLSITQLVFDGGKWWNNLSAAQLGAQAGETQVDEQRLQITYLVEQRFYELLRAQRQLQVFADAAKRSRDQADYTQRLFEGGRATQADVYAARANRDNDEVTRLGQERNVELARADLAIAVGIDPTEALAVAEPQNLMSDPAQPPPAPDAVARALEQRPSLKAFALTAEQNRKLASAAKGGYWPRVELFASLDRTTQYFPTFVDRPDLNSQGSAGVNITWNLFNGLGTRAAVEKANIQTALAENDLANGRRNVASDVEKAVAQLATARQQARVAQQAEQTAKEGLRLARTRQEVGVGTQLEVRDAELKLTQAQLNVVGSLVDGREAEAALRRAQGG